MKHFYLWGQEEDIKDSQMKSPNIQETKCSEGIRVILLQSWGESTALLWFQTFKTLK